MYSVVPAGLKRSMLGFEEELGLGLYLCVLKVRKGEALFLLVRSMVGGGNPTYYHCCEI
jgi:hypothetical protein